MQVRQCLVCCRPLKGRKDKIYCSDACRFEAWRDGIGRSVNPCIYCGLPADSTDHIPPQSVRANLSPSEREKFPFLEVKACRECNCLLGTKPFWTIASRKRYIKGALKARYAKYLKASTWSDEEMNSMGRNLKDYIRAGKIIARITIDRLKW